MLDIADPGRNFVLHGLDTILKKHDDAPKLGLISTEPHQSDMTERKTSLCSIQGGCLQVTSAVSGGCDVEKKFQHCYVILHVSIGTELAKL